MGEHNNDQATYAATAELRKRMVEYKEEMRKRLAALSFTEKIKILEKLRDREKAIDTAGLRRDQVHTNGEVSILLNRKEDQTDEHVFPAALGGNVVLKNAVCKTCNGGFSKDFEEQIVKRFEHFRHIFQIPDRRGNVPDIEVKIDLDGQEIDGRLTGTGILKPKPIFGVAERDGVKERVARYVSERQMEELSKAGWEKGETTPGRNVEGSFSGRLDFIDSPEMLRLAAKVAYVGLAFRMGFGFANRDTFADSRTYVQTGTGLQRARLFLNVGFLTACPQGPHHHSLVLAGQNNSQRVDAIVRFFGGLSYFVALSDQYLGADFSDTLVLDAHHGKTVTVLPTNLQSEFLQVNHILGDKETVWGDRIKSGEWFTTFIDSSMQKTQKS